MLMRATIQNSGGKKPTAAQHKKKPKKKPPAAQHSILKPAQLHNYVNIDKNPNNQMTVIYGPCLVVPTSVLLI